MRLRISWDFSARPSVCESSRALMQVLQVAFEIFLSSSLLLRVLLNTASCMQLLVGFHAVQLCEGNAVRIFGQRLFQPLPHVLVFREPLCRIHLCCLQS